MATFLTSIKCGGKTYNLSNSGSAIYFTSLSKTGGFTLKGVKYRNGEVILNSTNKPATEFNICEQIKKSL